MDKGIFRVLVVDSDPVLREALIDYLDTCDDFKAAGGAKNAAEAIALCATLNPDVILLDIQLPDMDGVNAVEKMRAHCPHAPIVVLTQSQMYTRAEEAMNAGVAAWLEKGMFLEQVTEALRLAALKRPDNQSPD